MTILPEVRVLDRLGYRLPLGVDCQDGVTGARVTDGLLATAWLREDPTTRFTAQRSPVSGLLGFADLPRMWRSTHVRVGPDEPIVWPAVPPTPCCLLVTDSLGRYLPASVAVDVPVSAPVVVPLSSAPTRQKGSGVATVRGELRTGAGAELGWALVRVNTGLVVYQSVADGRGRFLLHLPYPEALPPLLGNPPVGPGLSGVTWPLTVSARSEPGALVRSPGLETLDPPELGSVTTQGAAQLVDGGNHPSITATLRFGIPLVLALTAVPA